MPLSVSHLCLHCVQTSHTPAARPLHHDALDLHTVSPNTPSILKVLLGNLVTSTREILQVVTTVGDTSSLLLLLPL